MTSILKIKKNIRDNIVWYIIVILVCIAIILYKFLDSPIREYLVVISISILIIYSSFKFIR